VKLLLEEKELAKWEAEKGWMCRLSVVVGVVAALLLAAIPQA
jgi:hypothetical protein